MTERPGPWSQRPRVAVIGSGVAGLVAAWTLRRHAAVTVYEADGRAGGHTRTVTIAEGPDAGLPVDIGFIVMNHRNYPTLTQLFQDWEIPLRDSDMSFGYYDRQTGYRYAGTGLRGLFPRPRSLTSPGHWSLLREIRRFQRRAAEGLDQPGTSGQTLGDFLREGGWSKTLAHRFVLPMGAAIWSAPPARMLEFPARSYLRFSLNHGLIGPEGPPRWRTVRGGGKTYVDRVLRDLREHVVHLGTPVSSVRRHPDHVDVIARRSLSRFDQVVIATHADQALRLLADPSPRESQCLGSWRYSRNEVILHRDASVLPPPGPKRFGWASWNVVREPGAVGDEPLTMTYYMNRLQSLPTQTPWLVSLNPARPIAESAIAHATVMEHPVYDFRALGSQETLAAINGERRTWFCGSHLGYGFHEDAARAGMEAANRLLERWRDPP